MKMEKYKGYVIDCLFELIERALDARKTAESSRSKKNESTNFESGRALAYYEVISYLLNQTDAFEIKKDILKEKNLVLAKILKNFDPDKELIPGTKRKRSD